MPDDVMPGIKNARVSASFLHAAFSFFSVSIFCIRRFIQHLFAFLSGYLANDSNKRYDQRERQQSSTDVQVGVGSSVAGHERYVIIGIFALSGMP